MPYSFTLTTTLPASAQQIYDAWLDSLAHSQMTGGEALMSDELGAEVSAWNGYISGRNLELVPGARIVQSWRTTEFTDAHEDSTITVTLEETPNGTLLTLVHGNVPDEQRSYEQGGWQSNYFEPMQDYFAGQAPPAAKPQPKAKSKAKPKAKSKAQSKAQSKAKSKAEPKAKSAQRAKAGKGRRAKRQAAKAKPRGARRR